MLEYTRWRWSVVCQRPTIGSEWYYGNYSLGIHVGTHPRFRTFLLCLWFVEIGISCEREARWIETPQPQTLQEMYGSDDPFAS